MEMTRPALSQVLFQFSLGGSRFLLQAPWFPVAPFGRGYKHLRRAFCKELPSRPILGLTMLFQVGQET